MPGEMMAVLAFSITKIFVGDLDLVEQFYRGVLGLQLIQRTVVEEAGVPQEQSLLSLGGAAGSHMLLLARYLHRPMPVPGEVSPIFMVSALDVLMTEIEK